MTERQSTTRPKQTKVPITLTEVPVSAQGVKFTDTIDIDQEAHLLYYGDNWSGGVDVFDISTTKARYVKTIRIRGTFYGVNVAKEVQKLFVGVSGSSLAIIDIATNSPTRDTVIATVDTGGRAAVDLMDWDPIRKRLYAANRGDGFLTVIDGVSNKAVSRITNLGPGVEQPRYNAADGMLYVTDNRTSVLYQVDPKTNLFVRSFPVEADSHPNGLAVNPKTNMGLLACNNHEHPRTIIWDFSKQQIAAIINDVGNGDGALYNAKVDRFFFAADGFTGGPVIGIFQGTPAKFLTNVPTLQRGSWVAYDETHQMVYAPAIQEGKPALIGFPLPVL